MRVGAEFLKISRSSSGFGTAGTPNNRFPAVDLWYKSLFVHIYKILSNWIQILNSIDEDVFEIT